MTGFYQHQDYTKPVYRKGDHDYPEFAGYDSGDCLVTEIQYQGHRIDDMAWHAQDYSVPVAAYDRGTAVPYTLTQEDES